MKEVLDYSTLVFEEEGGDLAVLEEVKQVGTSYVRIVFCGTVCPAPKRDKRLLSVSNVSFSCPGLLLSVGCKCKFILILFCRAHCRMVHMWAQAGLLGI